MVNIHHLELFYYVARHRGISRAVRQMPYGIQQPAVSSQLLQLEEDLGVKLFERKPFRLTSHGEEVYAFIRPFFEGLDQLAGRLRKGTPARLRLGAAEFVLRGYLPEIIKRLKKAEPDIQVGLKNGFSREMEQWLLDGELDLAINPLEQRLPAGVRYERLARCPLALLVPRKAKLKSAGELWARKQILEPLIRLPATETITRNFLRGLKRKKVDWPLVMEVGSFGLVLDYVANDCGIGLVVDVPELAADKKFRVLRLEGFDPLEIVALWRGRPTALIETVVREAKSYVATRWGG